MNGSVTVEHLAREDGGSGGLMGKREYIIVNVNFNKLVGRFFTLEGAVCHVRASHNHGLDTRYWQIMEAKWL
jgi:hypothetical protein